MLLTYIYSAAVHGKGALAELSSSITPAVMTFMAQPLPLTNRQRVIAPPVSPCEVSALSKHPQGRRSKWGNRGAPKSGMAISELQSQDIFLYLGQAVFGKSTLLLLLLWLHQREKPATSKMFNANYIAGKIEEMVFGVCFGFRWGSGSVSAILLFVTTPTCLRSHRYLSWTSVFHWYQYSTIQHARCHCKSIFLCPAFTVGKSHNWDLFLWLQDQTSSSIRWGGTKKHTGSLQGLRELAGQQARQCLAHWHCTGHPRTVHGAVPSTAQLDTRAAKHPSALMALVLATQRQCKNWMCRSLVSTNELSCLQRIWEGKASCP